MNKPRLQSRRAELLYRLSAFVLVFMFVGSTCLAQTVITDNASDTSADASAVVEIKSTTKGFLAPRMTSAQRSAISGPAEGLLVYQTDGTKGYYFYNGNVWMTINHPEAVDVIAKTTSDTLEKSEVFVVGINDITITLPAVTDVDNGLTITIVNNGSHTDLINVIGYDSTTIAGSDHPSELYRWVSRTYVAYEGSWLIKDKSNQIDHVYDVSPNSSWTSIEEVLEFLSLHMHGAAVIRLTGDNYQLSATQIIDLPYPLTIQGFSYSTATIEAATGLAGSPMFICASECYFKMLIFDGSTLPGYGTQTGEDAIRLTGDGVYYEIKDNIFQTFHRAVVLSGGVELWMFENDVSDCSGAGVEVTAGSYTPFLKLSETDFYNCYVAVSLVSGSNSDGAIRNCGFYMNDPGQIGVKYVPSGFAPFETLYVTSNTWNNIGVFLSGFDFTRSDGRDAMAYIQNNAGSPDQNPMCKMDVVDNTTGTFAQNANTWYKANWTNTSSTTVKFTVANNRITYQPTNKRDLWMVVTGDLQTSSNNKTVSVAVIKNGVTSVLYGKTTIRISTGGQPYQFSTVVVIQNLSAGDYLELFFAVNSGYETVTFSNVSMFANTR